MAGSTTSTLENRRLRIKLRAIREEAGRTQKDVAEALEWSLSKVIRIETGAVGISITDLKALLSYYQVVDSEQIESMLSLARKTIENPWWEEYRNHLSSHFIRYIAYEDSASTIRNFSGNLIPGHLQIPEYMKTVLRSYDKVAGIPSSTFGLEVRMKRQEIL